VESSMRPDAVSPVGAAGLYQFMPATAERFGLRLRPEDERFDPEKSARAAAQYLRLLHRQFASWPLALAAYNCGEGRVEKTRRRTGATTFGDLSPHLPSETQLYVPKVLAVIERREGRPLR
jgi:membrane-bound lytic murein transglycosylase D